MTGTTVRLLLFLTVLSTGMIATATTFRMLTLPEMIGTAELAFRGTVTSTNAELHDGEPWTTVTFEIAEWLLVPEEPEEPEGRTELRFLGGTVAGSVLTVALMPEFQPGEEVLVLAYEADHYSPLVGFNQGLWRLVSGEWIDELGRPLGLDEDGNLSGGTAGPASEVTAELAELLEAR